MEHKIGDIITLPDGRKAGVVEAEGPLYCSGCVFWLSNCKDIKCLGIERADRKNIIYKEIKEE